MAAGGDTEARRQMRLTGYAWADQQDALTLLEVVTLDELQQELLVDAGPDLEVELIECLLAGNRAAFSLRSAELRRSN